MLVTTNILTGYTLDNDRLPVRLYSSWQQTNGKHGFKVYRVEFKNGNKWIEWFKSDDYNKAHEEFTGLTD